MNPPNPLTIDWLRENAKPGETVLVSETKEERIFLCAGKRTIFTYNPRLDEETTWSSHCFSNWKIKQPAKPKACAFIDDGLIRFALEGTETCEEFNDCYDRSPEHDIYPREIT